MLRFIFSILFLSLSFGFLAQETQKGDLYEKNKLRTKNLANEAIRVGDIYLALNYFELIYK